MSVRFVAISLFALAVASPEARAGALTYRCPSKTMKQNPKDLAACGKQTVDKAKADGCGTTAAACKYTKGNVLIDCTMVSPNCAMASHGSKSCPANASFVLDNFVGGVCRTVAGGATAPAKPKGIPDVSYDCFKNTAVRECYNSMMAELQKAGCKVSAGGCDATLALPKRDHWSCAAKTSSCYTTSDGICHGTGDKKLAVGGQHVNCRRGH